MRDYLRILFLGKNGNLAYMQALTFGSMLLKNTRVKIGDCILSLNEEFQ